MLDESQRELPGQRADRERVNNFKDERHHGLRFAIHAEMVAASLAYIEAFLNRPRQHSTLGYQSPTQYRDHWKREQNQGILTA
jgi:putative transposase